MLKIDLYEFISGLSSALSLTSFGAGIDWGSMEHSTRVCYITSRIAGQMRLDERVRSDAYYAALLHDSGVSSTKERRDLVQVDTAGEFSHCKRGYELLKKSPHTERFARIVLHHHDKWAGYNESGASGNAIPLCSRIICVADRVDILMRPREYILHQRDDIVSNINEHSGTLFDPQVVDAFNQITPLESFWLDLTSRESEELLSHYKPMENIMLNYDQLEDTAGIFAEIVDSKCAFTVQHSRRVARVAVALAERFHFSPFECEKMKIVGLLHDLGKLSIPDEILNKPDKLTGDEYEIIKRHTYFTYMILNKIRGFERIAQWASYHHERLDGKGYPFRTRAETFPLAARILAVSDTFAALAEERPYREGHSTPKICEVLSKCVSEGALDGKVVDVVTKEIDDFYKLLEI